MKGKRRGLLTGPPIPHQATQAGTGGSLPDFGGREPAKAPPSALDNWLTLEGFLDTPREYWEMLVAMRLMPRVPTRNELRRRWQDSSTVEMQFFRKALNPQISRQDLLRSSFEYTRPTGITPPEDGRVWNTATLDQWLTIPWLRRSVSITRANGSASGYIVGPRHVLTCAHGLPWVADGKGGVWGEEPDVVDWTIDLAKLDPPYSDFGQMDIKVHLFQGTLNALSKPPYIILGDGKNKLLSHSPVKMVVPFPPFPGPFLPLAEYADDYVILIMDDDFAKVTSAFGLGWDRVMPPSEADEVVLSDRFFRTGWGTMHGPEHCQFAVPVPPAPWGGYWGADATSRTEYNARFQLKTFFPASDKLKYAATIYSSGTSDANQGDSGSAYYHFPTLNGKSGEPAVAAVYVAESGGATVVEDDNYDTVWLKYESRNRAVGGYGLYATWLIARLIHP